MKPLEIPTLNKPTGEKILEYVLTCPGCTSRDIYADLDLSPKSVYMALKRLQNKALLRTEGQDDNGLKFWWPGDGKTKHPVQAAIKQETVTVWPAVTFPQQTPWSALGL